VGGRVKRCWKNSSPPNNILGITNYGKHYFGGLEELMGKYSQKTI